VSAVGGFFSRKSSDELSPEQVETVRGAALRVQARRLFDELYDLRETRDGIADREGRLYERVHGLVMDSAGIVVSERKDIAGFVAQGDDLVFLRRPDRGRPQTLKEAEAARAERRKVREQVERDRIAALEKIPRSPVLAGELLAVRPRSLREAAYTVEKLGGRISAKGELVVELPSKGPARAEGD